MSAEHEFGTVLWSTFQPGELAGPGDEVGRRRVAVRKAIEEGETIRDSHSVGPRGERDDYVRLVEYDDPDDRARRIAMQWMQPSGDAETIDFDPSRKEEATKAYEAFVREMAEVGYRYQVNDVTGVAPTHFLGGWFPDSGTGGDVVAVGSEDEARSTVVDVLDSLTRLHGETARRAAAQMRERGREECEKPVDDKIWCVYECWNDGCVWPDQTCMSAIEHAEDEQE